MLKGGNTFWEAGALVSWSYLGLHVSGYVSVDVSWGSLLIKTFPLYWQVLEDRHHILHTFNLHMRLTFPLRLEDAEALVSCGLGPWLFFSPTIVHRKPVNSMRAGVTSVLPTIVSPVWHIMEAPFVEGTVFSSWMSQPCSRPAQPPSQWKVNPTGLGPPTSHMGRIRSWFPNRTQS